MYSVSKNYSPVARQAKYYRIEQISQNITWVLDNNEKNHDENTNRFCIMFLNFTPCLFRYIEKYDILLCNVYSVKKRHLLKNKRDFQYTSTLKP